MESCTLFQKCSYQMSCPFKHQHQLLSQLLNQHLYQHLFRSGSCTSTCSGTGTGSCTGSGSCASSRSSSRSSSCTRPVPAPASVPLPATGKNMGDLILESASKLYMMLLITNLDDYIKNTDGLTVSIVLCFICGCVRFVYYGENKSWLTLCPANNATKQHTHTHTRTATVLCSNGCCLENTTRFSMGLLVSNAGVAELEQLLSYHIVNGLFRLVNLE
jgi:hypothetical protein